MVLSEFKGQEKSHIFAQFMLNIIILGLQMLFKNGTDMQGDLKLVSP